MLRYCFEANSDLIYSLKELIIAVRTQNRQLEHKRKAFEGP